MTFKSWNTCVNYTSLKSQIKSVTFMAMLCISVTSYFFTQGFTALLAFKFDKCRAQREHNQVKSVISANNQGTYFLNLMWIFSTFCFAFGLFSVRHLQNNPSPAPYFGPLLLIPHFFVVVAGYLCHISSNPLVSHSAKERRSRKPFLRQWSQVGHAKAQLSRKEMENWAKSLDALLDSRGERSVICF